MLIRALSHYVYLLHSLMLNISSFFWIALIINLITIGNNPSRASDPKIWGETKPDNDVISDSCVPAFK